VVGVLVTRPHLYGAGLTSQLRDEGYAVWHEPLLRIQALDVPRPVTEPNPLVVLTSPSIGPALAGRNALIQDLLCCPCYCVGRQTYSVAQELGFTAPICSDGNAHQLAHLILGSESERRPILHLGGETVSDEPAMTLRRAGWRVVPWSLYRAVAEENLGNAVRGALNRQEIHVVLFFSARTAQIFVKLVKEGGLEACCGRVSAIGLSDAVVGALAPLEMKQVLIASQPRQADLLRRLREVFPPLS